MKRFVVGDIHGAAKALSQCIERSNIDKEKDLLFCIGDVADGFPDVPDAFNTLLEFKNLVYIMGNHDSWMYHHIMTDWFPPIWTSQGGNITISSYRGRQADLKKHLELLDSAPHCYLTSDSKLFVHGGYDFHLLNPLKTSPYNMMWDRELLSSALRGWSKEELKLNLFKDVFIGHSQTDSVFKTFNISIDIPTEPYLPIHIYNLWDVDTGAGWSGKLTIMDIDTYDIFQSDFVTELYSDDIRK